MLNIAWLWAGVGQEVEYIGRHIQGAILKPRDSLHYPSVIDYQVANSDPMIEEGEIEMDWRSEAKNKELSAQTRGATSMYKVLLFFDLWNLEMYIYLIQNAFDIITLSYFN